MTRWNHSFSCSRNARPGARGFTIIELLMATFIMGILMFLINRLFFDTAGAVSHGMALNHILSDSQTVSEQFRSDADYMVGPSDGGFLVIINQVIPNVTIQTQKGPVTRDVRSDQLVFIRNAEGVEPLAPGYTTAFSNSTDATHAKVWYGHALRTDPGGSGPTVVGLGAVNGPNEVASNWILGRHALFLDGTFSSLGWPPSPPSIQVFARDAAFDSPVNYGNTTPPVANSLYMGLTDVCAEVLEDINAKLLGATDYNDQAYLYAFPDTRVSPVTTTQEQRLRVNPRPAGNTFESWRIAQMHPYFVENVSDFIVEFAADTDQTGDIDFHSGQGSVVWRSINDVPGWAAGYKSSPNYVLPGGLEARFTFRHDDPNYWPYMIRIRYRVHDPRGRFTERVRDAGNNVNTEPGMWFEQVIKVNRR